jgi:hypothetical protein
MTLTGAGGGVDGAIGLPGAWTYLVGVVSKRFLQSSEQK